MNSKEFKRYIEDESNAYQIFFDKNNADQLDRNKTRRHKAWNEAKIKRYVDKLWSDIVNMMYDKLVTAVGKGSYKSAFVDFMDENEVIPNFEDSMHELEV